MKFVLFYHSLVSDWNHGNAHFLRGVVAELLTRGHDVRVYEPSNNWSTQNLLSEYGTAPVEEFRETFPNLRSEVYDTADFRPDEYLDGADVVIVHEWNDHEVVRRIGEHRTTSGSYLLFFHDTHHRSVTEPDSVAAYDLSGYDGVLAFGRVIRDLYLKKRWTDHAWTWHEAADVRTFYPRQSDGKEGDIVWIGNWGDEERTAELHEFLLGPVRSLHLSARMHGVRYPEHALEALRDAGAVYRGWLPNYKAPDVFARYRATVHVPRRPYTEALPGIPTIRVFEALACGIPLVSAPWKDAEGLFTPGSDFLVARDGEEMVRHLRLLLNDRDMALDLAARGLCTVLQRHTCKHRVDELLAICAELGRTVSQTPVVSDESDTAAQWATTADGAAGHQAAVQHRSRVAL